MRKLNLELVVGLFVLVALGLFIYFSIRLGEMQMLGTARYELTARFANVGGLKDGAAVVIAGVEVGNVADISLEDYQAAVLMAIDKGMKVQEDAIAAIKTKGLFGEKYVEISPGGSEVLLESGQRIRETQPAVDLEALISKYVFSGDSGGDGGDW